MKIAINTRLLLKGRVDGIARFTFETVSRMVADHPEHEFYYFFDRKFDASFVTSDNITPVVLAPQARHPILFDIWFNYSVAWALKKHKIDLFISPDGYVSLRSKVPQIPIIHDLNFEHFPEDLPPKIAKYLRSRFPQFAKKAKRIGTVSEFSRQDIHTKYGIPLEQIDVVYNGVNDAFVPLSADTITDVRKSYSDGDPYFVYVGTLHPRKNILRMLKAFDQFKSKHLSKLKFLIVGEKMWSDADVKEAFESLDHKTEVYFTGRVSDAELYKIVGAAHAMCYASCFEGFGIPILEAMKCGVPVLTSNVSSMPEVAGEGAVLVDPFNIESIAVGMEQLMDPVLVENLVTIGFERCQLFNWEQSANQLWRLVENTISSGES